MYASYCLRSASSKVSHWPAITKHYTCLTFSSLQTNTDTFTNSADPDETAHDPSGSRLFAILLLSFDLTPYLQQWMCPNSDERVHFKKWWVKVYSYLCFFWPKFHQGCGIIKFYYLSIDKWMVKMVKIHLPNQNWHFFFFFFYFWKKTYDGGTH